MKAEWLEEIIKIAELAGRAILPFWKHANRLQILDKEDNTPLSTADLIANDTIVQRLQLLTPDIPILSEESKISDFDIRQKWSEYWLVDPLDGTRGFIDDSEEFSVNIALIRRHKPVMGVIYAPVTETFYYASENKGAYKKDNVDGLKALQTKKVNWDKLRVILGQYHHSKQIKTFIENLNSIEIVRLNSSLKFGQVAEGSVDVYPRFGPTGEWDTAAGQCILEEAGGVLVDLNGNQLQYNTKSSLVNPAFVGVGDPTALETILTFLLKL